MRHLRDVNFERIRVARSRRARAVLYTIAVAVMTACGSSTEVEPVNTSDPLALFERVHADVEAKFSFFDRANVDWSAIRVVYRDSVRTAGTRNDADRAIGRMVQRLGDYHATLFTPSGGYSALPIPFPHHFDVNVVQGRYLVSSVATSSRRIRYGRIAGSLATDVGYIAIRDFGGAGWGGEIEDALAALGAVRAIIVDVRDNGGGDEAIARDVAARFYDRSRTYRISQFRTGAARTAFGSAIPASLDPGGARRFTGPVALITNRFNGSAAEDFICMLRVLPQVTTVGDTTIGNGSNPLRIEYGSGYALQIPQSRQSTPDGFIYQYVGLPPRLPVRWSAADSAGGRDPYLDAALSVLRGAP